MARPAEPVDAAWRDIRRHLDRAPDAPLLVYAFAADSEPVRELVRRLRVALRARGVPVRHLAPRSPEALRELLATVFDEPGALVILDAPRADGDGRSEWADAWATVIARLNAGREQVRTELRGLILAMPAAFRGRAHATGPDLWSVHDVVCELGVVEHNIVVIPFQFGGASGRRTPPPPDVALAAAEALEAREGRNEGWARTLIDAIPGLVARGEEQRALQLGRTALKVLSMEDARRPELLAGVAEAEAATGDIGAAVAHWQEAASTTDELHPDAIRWLVEAGTRLGRSSMNEEAVAVVQGAVQRARARARLSASPSERRALAATLDQLGHAFVGAGALADGAAAYEEALALARENLLDDPTDSLARVAVCQSAISLGNLLAVRGRKDEAKALFEEVVALSRRVLSNLSWRTWVLPRALGALGRLAFVDGRLSEAEGLLEEARELFDEAVGGNEQTRLSDRDREGRDYLAYALDALAQVHQARKDYVTALVHFERAVELVRSLLGYDDDPRVLGNLAACLNNLSACASEGGSLRRASTTMREAVEVRRRLVRLLDHSPRVVYDLTLALGNLAIFEPTDADVLLAEARAALASIPEDHVLGQELADLTIWLDQIPTSYTTPDPPPTAARRPGASRP